jgi:hypothetical protein
MKGKKWIVTVIILSASLGLASQTVQAQSRPLENPTSEEQFETRGTPPRSMAGEYQGMNDYGGIRDTSESDVQNVKVALKQKGYDPGPINGELDLQAQKALREFQQRNNLPGTGAIDEATAARLGVKIPNVEDSLSNPESLGIGKPGSVGSGSAD